MPSSDVLHRHSLECGQPASEVPTVSEPKEWTGKPQEAIKKVDIDEPEPYSFHPPSLLCNQVPPSR